MSEDERDMDMESEDDDMEDDDMNDKSGSSASTKPMTQAEKRAHHNALERKRRDHIKDSFTSLRDSVPALHGEKQSSRAQILKKAAEYIQLMRRKNTSHQHDIEDLKRQNNMLETQIRTIEKTKGPGSHLRSSTIGSGSISNASPEDEDIKLRTDSDNSDSEFHSLGLVSPTASSNSGNAIPVTLPGGKKIKLMTVTGNSMSK